MSKPKPSDAIAVITVHGTGDAEPEPQGSKWWQPQSNFGVGLTSHLRDNGVHAVIVPHVWSGANSAYDRETAADRLASLVRRLSRSFKQVHVIAHSHGGNIACDAAYLLQWGRQKARPQLSSVTTVGTPFINSVVSAPWAMTSWAFRLVTFLSVAALPLAFIAGLFLIAQTLLASDVIDEAKMSFQVVLNTEIGTNLSKYHAAGLLLLALVSYGFFVSFTIQFMWDASRRNVNRTFRPRWTHNEKVFAIVHPQDEAIAALQRVDNLPINAFPPGSLRRSTRRAAVNVAASVVLFLCIVGPALMALIEFGYLDWDPQIFSELPTLNSTVGVLTLAAMTIAMSPIVFRLTYWTYRSVVGSFLEWFVRGPANTAIAEIVRGIAFGRDTDHRFRWAGNTPALFDCRLLWLEGEVADQMRMSAAEAANSLIERYRWSLFSNAPDGGLSFRDMSRDSSTWDSLIHTIYFDQPSIVKEIAEYVTEVSQRLSEEPSRVAESLGSHLTK